MLIVGGGPAGSTGGRFAASHGLAAAVVECAGTRPPKRASAGIFDRTWRSLGLSVRDYPHAIQSPNAAEFRTLNNGRELTTAFNTVVERLNRHVFFPNRDEFDRWLHIGTAHMSSHPKAKKKHLLFAEFAAAVKSSGQLDPHFDPKEHRASGGCIRMFANRRMVANGGTCFVIGDSAGVLQRDVYNGISNAILSGRLCAEAIAQGDREPRIRTRLNRYLFMDVLRDMLGSWLPAGVGAGSLTANAPTTHR